MIEPLLSADSLVKEYPAKGGNFGKQTIFRAVDGVSLAVSAGETVGIAGESGCGKSTVARMLAGLIAPEQGAVTYRGTPLESMSKAEQLVFRRQVQMVFQDPFSSLNPRMRIGDAVAEPLLLGGTMSGQEARNATEGLFSQVGVPAEWYGRFPHELSGGQRQRVVIARALSSSPSVLIADEPVSSLDISIQAQIINLLMELKMIRRLSMAVISHDLSVLRHICDRIYIMYLGRVVESGPAQEVIEQSRHPYTTALVSSSPTTGTSKKKRILLTGDIPSPVTPPSGCRFHTRCPHVRDICRNEIPAEEAVHSGGTVSCHRWREISE